jgi:tRNA(Ile)-lysidine synthase
MEILQQVAEFIERHHLLSPGQSVIAGVSGGADSLCLLACLHNLGYQVTIAHLDHQLRSESVDEARFVERIGEDLGLETVVGKGNVRELADRGFSLEEAARLIRYKFLARVADEKGIDRISTGHTADDQIETVLMHFLRGAGPSGLRGILPDTRLSDWVDMPETVGVQLIRPLLEIRRSETEAYCRELNLDPVQDPSNKDPLFFRNRIRHHLIPILKEYNPGIGNIILRMAQVMQGEVEMVKDILEDKWKDLVLEGDSSGIRIHRKNLRELPLALRRSFLRHLIKHLDPKIRDIDFDNIERGIEFLSGPLRSGRHQLLAGLEIINLDSDSALLGFEDHEVIFPEYPQFWGQKSIASIPCCIQLESGWELCTKYMNMREIDRDEFLDSLDTLSAAVDVNSIKGQIQLRTIRSGDRISPLGFQGRIKISDLFINCKVPQPARKKWPLIVDDEKVIWVVGLRIADDCRITSKTKQIIHLQAVPSGRRNDEASI